MADTDGNWQIKCLSIRERTEFFVNKELLSDVKFVVPAESNRVKKGSKLVIPAHKFALAISSPTFFTMF